LYDLATDPAQQHDLAAHRLDALQELTEVLKKVRERDNDAKVK
jgi:hypothetical protein